MGDRARSVVEAAWRRPFLAALVVSVVFAAAGTFQHDLWTPDEPRDAQMGKEMLESGFSALPTLGGEPFLEKPPLFFWMVAAAFRVFGVSDGVARLPSAVASVATGLIAYAIARRTAGRSAGVFAAAVLVSFSEYWSISHKALNDVVLTAFVAGGHLAFLVARDRFRAGRSALPAFAAAGACCGLGFLTKGIVAPVLLAGPVVLALAATRQWAFLGHVIVTGGTFCLAGVAVFAGPWVVALWNLPGGPDHVRVCLVDQFVARSTGESDTIGAHPKGPLYYLSVVPGTLAPWTLALPAVWLSGVLRGRRFRRVAFVAGVFVAGVALLSVPSGKRELYLQPLLPAAAVVFAVWLSRCSPARRADRVTSAVILGGMGGAALLGATGAVAMTAGLAPAPERVSIVVAEFGRPFAIAVSAVAGAGGLLLVRAARRALDPARPRLGARLACGVAVVFLFAHVVGRPLINPGRSLRDGAIALAAAVPADEPMMGFKPDELTTAVVGFYAGRRLLDVPPDELLSLLRRGRARHVVVVEKRWERAPDSLRAVLRSDAEIELSASRTVTVYRYDAALDTQR